jgi:prepilin-type N-terminal cleavage/methylation domain-containing protein
MYLLKWRFDNQLKLSNGFTLIELLLVVALIATIAVMTAPFAGQLYQRVNLETTTSAVVSALHKAQSNSLEGKGNNSWGICLNGSNVRVYLGSCASPTQKEDWGVVSTMTISGLSDTTFSRLRGEPSGALSITVSNLAGSNTITANLAGGIW